jgi:3-oxoadipate enol-lactonase
MLTAKVNGISIAYEQRGKGTPLVLLHGYPLDHSIWEEILPFLENDFDLILPDLRGFGESETVVSKSSMSDLAGDVAGLLDHLHIQKAAIVGHSMGGYVALAFTRAYPRRLCGLGLVASQSLADSPETKAGRYQQAETILAKGVTEVAESMSAKLTGNPALQARLKELILRQRPEVLSAALRAMAERPDSTLLLSELDTPIVLVHGLADGLIPFERARIVKAAVPEAYLTEIPGSGHMPMLEYPQKTAEALKALLKSAQS